VSLEEFNIYLLAAWQGHKEVVELLLSAGASLSVVDAEVIEPSVNLSK
jgi:ankyrin repeat protein